MPQYRKRPLIIDAELYHPGLEDGIEECMIHCVFPTTTPTRLKPLIQSHLQKIGKIKLPPTQETALVLLTIDFPYINTLEGRHYITPGDYIITGIKGERYPCKPDIFYESYEPDIFYESYEEVK